MDHVMINKNLQCFLQFSLWRKMVISIPINSLWVKVRMQIEVKAAMGLYSGCHQRWGWCKKLWTQISQLQLQMITSPWKLWRSSKISSSMAKIAKSTHQPPATTIVLVLGFVQIVTQPLPLFGGVALEVLRLFFFFNFVY